MRANSTCYVLVDADNYDYTYVTSFLCKFENFGASPYYPTAAEAATGIKTIGYGHRDRNHEYADNYVMSEEEAFKLLISDIKDNYPEEFINEIIKSHGALTQNQMDALVALRFNNYMLNVNDSPDFLALLKQEYYGGYEFEKQVVYQFLTYTKQNGVILGGLVKRSTAEAMLFLENEYFEDYTDLYSDDEVKDRYKEFLEKYGYGDMAEYIR